MSPGRLIGRVLSLPKAQPQVWPYNFRLALAGNCLAGGYYTDRAGHRQTFVASERNGTWHTAIEVPGTSALNKGVVAGVYSVSCASAGHCAVGGAYEDGSANTQAFVASQT